MAMKRLLGITVFCLVLLCVCASTALAQTDTIEFGNLYNDDGEIIGDTVEYPIGHLSSEYYDDEDDDFDCRILVYNPRIEFVIDNYDELAERYGYTLDISVNQLEGSHLDWHWQDRDDGDNYLYFSLDEMPEAAEDLVYEFTFEWGDAEATLTRTLRMAEAELPGDVDRLPDIIDVMPGRSVVCAPRFVPASTFGSDKTELYIWNENESIVSFSDNDTAAVTIHGLRPGVSRARVQFSDYSRNVYYCKDIKIRVLNEDGSEPLPTFELDTMPPQIVPIWEGVDESSAPQVDRIYIAATIRDYDEYEPMFTGRPVWTITQLSGQDVGAHPDWEGWAPADVFGIWIDHLPSEDTEADFTVTCQWDESVETATVHMSFRTITPPEGLDLPDVITLKVGEQKTYPCGFLPQGWALPDDFGAELELEVDSYNSNDIIAAWISEDDGVTVSAKQPGYASIYVSCSYGHLNLSKNVEVIVTDENGNPPPPDLSFEEDAYEYAFTIAPLEHEYGKPWFNRFMPSIQLRNYHGPDPEWAITQLPGEGKPVACHLEPWEYTSNSVDFWIDEMPDESTTAVYRVTCTAGDISNSVDVTIHFVKRPLPTGVDCPTRIELKPGESMVLSGGFISDDPYWEDAYFYIDSSDDEDVFYSLYYVDDDKKRITALKPFRGTIIANVSVDNVIIEQPIELVISESAGDRRVLDLPANLTTIEANAFEGTSARTVILPEGCTSIGARAFAGCRDLEDVYIPTTLTSIAADAFANSPNVRFIIGNNPTAESYAKKHGIDVIGE